jgi:prepilin-type N-terminal cleavage/methylation domain-containing protein
MTFATGQRNASREASAFTLVELILVMAILSIAVSVAAPTMSGFFKGRKQGYEARRILSIIRDGQTRAVAEGVPVWLWFDVKANEYGMEEDPSYIDDDPKAIQCSADPDVTLGIEEGRAQVKKSVSSRVTTSTGSKYVSLRGRSLPAIRFQPDGTFGEGSLSAVSVSLGQESILYVAQAENGLSYELLNQNEVVRNTFR